MYERLVKQIIVLFGGYSSILDMLFSKLHAAFSVHMWQKRCLRLHWCHFCRLDLLSPAQ